MQVKGRFPHREFDVDIGPVPTIPVPLPNRTVDNAPPKAGYMRDSARDSGTSIPTDSGSAILSLNEDDLEYYDDATPDASPVRPTKNIPAPYLPLRKSSMHRSRLNRLQTEMDELERSRMPRDLSPESQPQSSTSMQMSPVQTLPKHDPPSPPEDSMPDRFRNVAISPTTTRVRARGFTTVGPVAPRIIGLPKSPSVRKIKPAMSIPELPSFRKKTSSTSRNDTPTNSTYPNSPRHKNVSDLAHQSVMASTTNGESRSSYRTNGSQVTYASSTYMDASETERSSILTRASSVSNRSKQEKQEDIEEDEGLSVEDAIAMYANGFEDDPEPEVVPGAEIDKQAEHSNVSDPAGGLVQQPQRSRRTPPSGSPIDPSAGFDFHTRSLRRASSVPDLTSSPTDPHARRSISPGPRSPTPPPKDFDFGSVLEPIETNRTDDSLQPEPPMYSSVKNLPEVPREAVPRDRYGFKKSNQNITVEQYDAWNMGYSDYLDKRKEKWLKLMQTTHLPTEKPTRFPPKSDKVKRYIRKGIPPEWRGAAWFWYAGGPQYLVEAPGLYYTLVERCEQGDLSDSDREHIERDLNRTFPDNIKFKPDVGDMYMNENMPGRDVRPGGTLNNETTIVRSLRRVLQAFAVHNPSIGYCQSLNFLAGLLLLFLHGDEEKSFVLLNIITNKHLPGTHAKVLEANVDIGVLMTCIQESMPAIWAKIDDKNDTDKSQAGLSATRLPTVSLATTAWFMSLFIGSLPIEAVLRVWDVFFYEGSKTLFRIALAIFKSGESEIRSVTDNLEIFQVVQSVPRKLLDINGLMESCYRRKNGFGHLGQDVIDRRREERRWALKWDRARLNGEVGPDGHVIGSPDLPLKSPNTPEKGFGGGLRRAATRARLMRSVSRKRVPTAGM